jgi:hypothetical protein
MKRSDVNKHINDERKYQELRWNKRNEEMDISDDQKPVTEWINYMEYHLSKAKENIYHLNEEEALAEIRKVTALGVKTMEIHGCPQRIIPKELIKENLK